MSIKKPVIDHPLTVGEVAIGGVMPSTGNSADYETGSWRTERPAFDPTICTSCLICWITCPDTSILVESGKVIGIDAKHCKGCGICAKECPTKPTKAIVMLAGGIYLGDEAFDRRGLERGEVGK